MMHLGEPAARQHILDRIARLQPDARPHWGRMSANQMLCHLSDSFRAAMGEKRVTPATGVVERTLLKWLALYLPVRWPKGFRTRPEVEQGRGGTPPVDFRRDRDHLVAAFSRFSRPQQRLAWPPHPIFGILRDSEWLRWGYLHADHHLRQFGV